MTTMTKTRKTESSPPTFASIARRKMKERIEAYRKHVRRAADGEQLNEADLSDVADLLSLLSLPDYSWSLHIEATKRHDIIRDKLKAAVAAEPENRQRTLELTKDIEDLEAKLRMLLEERRKSQAGSSKSAAYGHSLRQIESDNAVALGDIDTAVTLRLTEQEKRRATS
jgi:hypothetical protein